MGFAIHPSIQEAHTSTPIAISALASCIFICTQNTTALHWPKVRARMIIIVRRAAGQGSQFRPLVRPQHLIKSKFTTWFCNPRSHYTRLMASSKPYSTHPFSSRVVIHQGNSHSIRDSVATETQPTKWEWMWLINYIAAIKCLSSLILVYIQSTRQENYDKLQRGFSPTLGIIFCSFPLTLHLLWF